MTNVDVSARTREILEEELGEFRAFSELPASEIEAMAARLTRALAPVLEAPQREFCRSAA